MSDFLKSSFNSWYKKLYPYLSSQKFNTLGVLINRAYKNNNVLPEKKDIFNAFKYCPVKDLKVVILGLDPYPNVIDNKPVATGLAFANNSETHNFSSSLKIIIEELEVSHKDLCFNFDQTLVSWAKQGVLMLNSALTVIENNTGSHLDLWSDFTRNVLQLICEGSSGIIFVLVGRNAQSYRQYILEDFHHIIEVPFPIDESYRKKVGFIGSNVFIEINKMLEFMNGKENLIKWM